MGFGSGFNIPGGMRSVSASADELSVFVNPKVVQGFEELRFEDGQLILTGNIRVSGTISASNGIIGTGSTTPGGSNQQIQYNNSNLFGGAANFTFNSTTNTVTTPQLSISGNTTISGNIVPLNDTQYSLGTPSKRFSNIYTGDLHLKNERGDWTLFEERDMLVVVNNITGKKYKINLIEI